jgi:hypothetical protein
VQEIICTGICMRKMLSIEEAPFCHAYMGDVDLFYHIEHMFAIGKI